MVLVTSDSDHSDAGANLSTVFMFVGMYILYELQFLFIVVLMLTTVN